MDIRHREIRQQRSGKGVSLGAPGPVVAGGTLYVGSGHVGTGNGILGNALLAFSAH